MKTLPLSLAIASAISGSMITHIVSAEQPAEAVALDVVTVSADFRDTNVQELPEAVTVIGADDIAARSAQHLESVLSFAPNVNFSSGASRGRYFQIRGIGERSQFIDPVNPSVGLMIDGIDMTGLGGAATLFDVKQVEVLRGPQGTRFGANALAGMINIKSNDATKKTEGYVAAKAGNYNMHSESAAISGSITDNVQARIAVNSFQSDGYMENEFLDKDNTNNLDEVVARGKLAVQLSADTNLGLTYLYADIDNGYDAFSLEKNRTTSTDQPGVDAQDTNAIALSINSRLSDAFQLETEITSSWTQSEYSYDDDWSYPGIAPGWEYKAYDQYLRDYQRSSADLRILSGGEGRILSDTSDWVVGLYLLQRKEDFTRNYQYIPQQFESSLESSSVAMYGEIGSDLTSSVRLISGLRIENWNSRYDDNNSVKGKTNEVLVGGEITLESMLNINNLAYISFARGYKAGGVNTNPDISEANREYDTEFNNTVELGLKSSILEDNLTTRLSAFYIQRKNQQVKSSYSYLENNTPKFQDYLANAAEGKNYGLEFESDWNLNSELNWSLSAGYLLTEFVDYTYENDDGVFSKNGRDQAHAPEYSLASAISYLITPDLSLRLESEAKDKFYYSDSHDQQSAEYVLLHARIEYSQSNYSIALYGRNITDRDYTVKGYYFGIDPRLEYAKELQEQLGEPRLVGIEGKYQF
ncbi:MAG: iron complex outermembrane receptor protein [Oleispira sp.]|jgi:iron complex outermembrane receptor protein